MTARAPHAVTSDSAAQDSAITEKYWKLTELMGQPVKSTESEAYITLKAEDHRIIGSGGCNRLLGSYELAPGNRLRFSQTGSTMMACAEGMDTERQFLDVLGMVDSYSVNGDKLELYKARMAPLARFEAVYMH